MSGTVVGNDKSRWILRIAAQVAHSLAFALWFGGIIGIGALVAPAAFSYTANSPQLAGNAELQKTIAGGILGLAFHGLDILSLAAGIVMLVADSVESVAGQGVRFRTATFARSLLTIALLVIVVYQGMHILPVMDRPSVHGTTLFDSLHKQYVFLTQLQVPVLLAIACITAWRNETWK